MNKIGVHFGYFNRDWDTDFVKQIETIKRIGLDILEVAPAPLMALTKQQRDEIAAAARDNEIDLTFSVGLGLDQDLASEDENIRKNGIKFTTDTFKIMSEMGGKMYSGVDIAAWNKTFTEGVTDKSASWERSISAVKEIMKSAEDRGITFAVEVVNRYESSLVNTAEEAIKYVDEVGSPNCKILLDTYHMNIEEDNMFTSIKNYISKIGCIHICENHRGVPGTGHIDWKQLIETLEEVGYDGFLEMETFTEKGTEVARGMGIWRQIGKETPLEEAKKGIHFLKKTMKQEV